MFDINKPAPTDLVGKSDAPIRENFRALYEDQIVDAGKLQGKSLVDFVLKSGGTFTGNVSVPDAKTDMHAVNKGQLNSIIIKGSGSPEGVQTSIIVGQLYIDTVNKALFMKSTPTGNTGWVDVTGKQKITITQIAHGFSTDFVFAATDGKFYKAIANDISKLATHFAVTIDANTFDLYFIGDFPINLITDVTGANLVVGEYYFLSNSVAGKITRLKPTTDIGQCVLKVNSDTFNLDISDPQYIGRDIYNCPPIGQIFDWGLSVPPTGAVFAQGQTISASTYFEFTSKAIASNDIDEYGVTKTKLYQWADAGHTSIILPSLCGRVRIGAGAGQGLTNRAIGEIGGEEKHQLTIPEMPTHNHITNYTGNMGTGTAGTSRSIVQQDPLTLLTTANTGGDLPHNNMTPYIAIPVCIQLKYVTGVDPAIFEQNASTLEGFHAAAFALANGNPAKLFEALDGATGKQVVNISQFAKLFSGNGYTKLPNGLIIQWGSGIYSYAGTSITFPVAFPNGVLTNLATGGNDCNISANAYYGSLTNMTVKPNTTSGNWSVNWLAIGY